MFNEFFKLVYCSMKNIAVYPYWVVNAADAANIAPICILPERPILPRMLRKVWM